MSRVTAFSGSLPLASRFLSGKTILTFITSEVGMDVNVGVREFVAVAVDVGVCEGVTVGVRDGV